MFKKIALNLFLLFALAFSLPANATIGTLQNSTTVFGNGSTTVFTANFVPDSVNSIQVIYTNATGVQTTLPQSTYLVAISPTPPGDLWPTSFTVTYPLSGSPIASGTSLTIQRILPLIQTTDLTDQGAFYPSVVEQALDVGVMQGQQISARTGQIRGTWLTDTLYNFGDIVVDGPNGNNTGNLYVCAIANTSTTWTNDLSVGDWSLALNVQGIVNTLPQINNNFVYGNISGITAAPYGVGVSALLDSAIGSTQGDILYRSGSLWTVLPPGTNGQVLKTQGSSANPVWGTVAGSGTVTEIDSGTGLTGGPVTSSGTLSLATIANNSLMANATGGSAAPGATTISAFLDSALGSTQGSILYRGGTVWNVLTPGTAGQVLQTGGSAANPSWAFVSSLSSPITNSLASNVSLSNTSNYYDGPSVAQGTSGTWFASGTVTIYTPNAGDNIYAKLWDGTTVIASTAFNQTASVGGPGNTMSLSGFLANPAGNLRISVCDTSSTSGKIISNLTGNAKDSTITAIRIE